MMNELAIPKTIAVIFDNDGVLCNTESLSSMAFEACLKEFGIQLRPGEINSYCGLTGEHAFQLLEKTFGFAPDPAVFWPRKHEIYQVITETHPIRPIPGAHELLDDLTLNGIPFALASSAGPTKILYNLQHAGLSDYFKKEWIISGNDVQNGKPHPEIFLKAAEKMGVPPKNCIGIEDSLNGLLSVNAAGMTAVALTTTFPHDRVAEYAAYVYPDLKPLNAEILRQILSSSPAGKSV